MAAEILYLDKAGDAVDLTLTATYGATSKDKYKKKQVVVEGTIEGRGDGRFRVYASEAVLKQLVKLGLVERPGGTDKYGEEVVKLTTPGARIHLARVSLEGKSYAGWSVTYTGGKPVSGPVGTPAPAAAGASATPSTGMPSTKPQEQAARAKDDERRKREARAYWGALHRTGKGCVKLAEAISGFTLQPPEPIKDIVAAHVYRARLEFVHSLASTLFIQARRDGHLVPPPENGNGAAAKPAAPAERPAAPAAAPAPRPAARETQAELDAMRPVPAGDAYEDFPEDEEDEGDDLPF